MVIYYAFPCFHSVSVSVFSGEVDAIDTTSGCEGCKYVEFKTNREIEYNRQRQNFQRYNFTQSVSKKTNRTIYNTTKVLDWEPVLLGFLPKGMKKAQGTKIWSIKIYQSIGKSAIWISGFYLKYIKSGW